ncbi:hypothetical protein GCM10025771_31470 [Niveibacterium umoris]|uniref:3-oxoacyl-[acyl-carrier-protein] synthase-1 n=1 Tax=Niveibacterium umoris TaxID=1193620 RepID=A0A840BMD9_9RHOO|nr:hypothetical protein [Niveibacterium umoris]MBB4011657.1 3-oxoacyl-[acyl-carrier-protein] synthase-1 [Niveibacterium umoris]
MDVLAYGMVTALGGDAATSCAAARAGLVRSRTLEHFRMRSAVSGEEEPVIGHPVVLLTQGFEGNARLLRLLHGALSDLAIHASTRGISLDGLSAYLALPASDRTDTGDELIADASVRSSRQQDREPGASPIDEHARGARLLQGAAALARWPAAPFLAGVFTSGNAAGLAALRAAAIDLSSGRCTRALVIGVDSLLDASTLNWLQVQARLKCDGAPSGLQPGEAACALLLAAAEPTLALGRIAKMAVAEEPDNLFAGATCTGAGLARVLAEGDAAPPDQPVWLISDHSGETWRGSELGHAITRMRSQSARYATPAIDYPAIAFGDTASASSLVATIWALRAFARHYAPADGAIIAASSEGSLRAAVTVQRVATTETGVRT